MKTYKLTKRHFNELNEYVGTPEYAFNGKITQLNWDGHLHIDPDLGVVRFPADLYVSGDIVAYRNTGIVANNIKSCVGIDVSGCVKAKNIISDGNLYAGGSLDASSVQAVDINARSIHVSGDITADGGIVSRYEIDCGGKIICDHYILAGTNSWLEEEQEIRCSELVRGRIRLGKLVIAPKKEHDLDDKIIEIDGKKYQLVPLDE